MFEGLGVKSKVQATHFLQNINATLYIKYSRLSIDYCLHIEHLQITHKILLPDEPDCFLFVLDYNQTWKIISLSYSYINSNIPNVLWGNQTSGGGMFSQIQAMFLNLQRKAFPLKFRFAATDNK